MTIIASTGNSVTGAANQGTLDFLIIWLDFMRGSPGWTIPRSSDGVSGGAGDFIDSAADLSQYSAGVSESWFVLRSPDGSRELKFYRTTSDDDRWDVNYSVGALYIGGDAGNQATATDEQLVWQGDLINGSTNFTVHFTADDASPYGWAFYGHAAGDSTSQRAAMMFTPISSTQPGELDPYIMYNGTSNGFVRAALDSESAAFGTARCTGFIPGSLVDWNAIPALMIATNSSTDTVFPNGCPLDDNNADVSMPVPFGRRSGAIAPNGFKGFSTFCQWNGALRAPLETFASQTRISFGDVNFPWDGSTTPTP